MYIFKTESAVILFHSLGELLATVVVAAYMAKRFYKKVVITSYHSITIRLIFN